MTVYQNLILDHDREAWILLEPWLDWRTPIIFDSNIYWDIYYRTIYIYIYITYIYIYLIIYNIIFYVIYIYKYIYIYISLSGGDSLLGGSSHGS